MSDATLTRRERRELATRRVLNTIAALLGLMLVGLILYLVWLQVAQPDIEIQRTPQGNLAADLVIGGPGTGAKPGFDRPLGAAFGPQGQIYVADSGNNRIVEFDKDGKFVREFGSFGVAKPAAGAKATWKPGNLNFPVGVDVDADNGDVYVADFYNDSISVFDSKGTFLRRFPDPEKPVGKGSSGQDGRGIAVTDVQVEGQRVFATDQYQIFVFSKNGRMIQQFGRPGTGPAEFDRPNGVTSDGNGNVYVADSNNSRLSAFTLQGKPLWQAGRPVGNLKKPVDTIFNLPRGVALMPGGDIIVTDALEQQLVRISPDGKVVAEYGVRGELPAQLNFPNSIDVLGDKLLVADKENNRVQVLRIVQKADSK